MPRRGMGQGRPQTLVPKLDYQYLVCHTCRVTHPARTDRVEQEFQEYALRHRNHSLSIRPEWWHYLFGGRYRGNANVKEAFGTSTSITCNIASLANGSGRECTAVDNSSNLYMDAFLRLHIKLQTGTPSGDKAIWVYAYGSEDGTNYTDNATGSDAALTFRVPSNLKPLALIAMPDSGALTYKSHPIAMAAAFNGILPRKWGFAIYNGTGIALDATEGNHVKAYS